MLSSSAPLPSSPIRLGIARGVSYGLFGPPDAFVAASRGLGAGLIRVYVYWGQVQPAPDRWDWTTVDALLGQLSGEEEVWVTVCSSSPWATQVSSDFLPSSPASDGEAFSEFVRALVLRCAGRVQYWQCNNEPSNTGLLWAGSAEDYVTQLRAFHDAVRSADPGAAVVLGGCGYDVLSAAPGDAPRLFFDHVLRAGREWFDLFAVHLYDEPARIPHHIDTVRDLMRAHGYERPVLVGEYNGPTLFQMPEAEPVLQETMMRAFAGVEVAGGGEFSTEGLTASAEAETPERRAMKALYERMAELPPQLQMLMAGCPPELEKRRHRINCREIVTRNLFALAAGARRTVCWHLAPEVPHYEDPFTMMELLQGKLLLLRHDDDGGLTVCLPAAETFRRLADHLDGAVSVTRVDVEEHPEVFAFTIERPDAPEVTVLFTSGDLFSGEEAAAVPVHWPWPHDEAVVVDALGTRRACVPQAGVLTVPASVTPLFLIPPPPTHPPT